jgi:hypothetical protein
MRIGSMALRNDSKGQMRIEWRCLYDGKRHRVLEFGLKLLASVGDGRTGTFSFREKWVLDIGFANVL